MASDLFLKLTGIDGESTDEQHPGEIELLAFAAGVSMPVGPRSTAGSATLERAMLSDVCVSKLVDASSPALFKAACQGVHIGEARISVNRRQEDNRQQIQVVIFKMLRRVNDS